MTEPIPPTNGPTGFPDIDDPHAITVWLDGIEQSVSDIRHRQELVLDKASADHDIFMLKTRPLPIWVTPDDRRRAWTVLGAGLLLALLGAVALVTRITAYPLALAPLLLACPLWFFVALHEVTRFYRHRSSARLDRDAALTEATQRRDAATARLAKLDEPDASNG